MKKFLFSLSFMSLMVVIGCKSNSTSNTDKKATEKVYNPNIQTVGIENYTVDIPTGWTSKEKLTERGKMFIIFSDTLFTDSSTSMNILTERMPKDDIEKYRDFTIKSILAGMPGTTIINKGDIEAGDLKGKWFTSRMQDSDDKIDAINYSFPKDGVAYIITGAMGVGQLDKHRGMLDSIAKSLSIKE